MSSWGMNQTKRDISVIILQQKEFLLAWMFSSLENSLSQKFSSIGHASRNKYGSKRKFLGNFGSLTKYYSVKFISLFFYSILQKTKPGTIIFGTCRWITNSGRSNTYKRKKKESIENSSSWFTLEKRLNIKVKTCRSFSHRSIRTSERRSFR